MVPMPPSIKDIQKGGRISRMETLLKLNEQLRVTSAAK
ncbi:hypothetical protein J2T19_002703 [Paenibacillus tundrae]|uniref:Uncharacterized protein n=1 Tax=Paenibacillus tundrae TaxID=528187 RepID=A0ABT9WDB7_9BACL|nr:hypothetical protein [Paenibacillus tundrae]